MPRDGLGDHCSRSDGSIFSNGCLVDDFCSRATINAFFYKHLSGNVAGGHECGIILNDGVVPDRTTQIQDDEIADLDVGGDDVSGTNDAAFPNGYVFWCANNDGEMNIEFHN